MEYEIDRSSVRSPLLHRSGVRIAIRAIAIVLIIGAFTACVWRPDSLTALTLIPAWVWLLPALITVGCTWRLNERNLALTLGVVWTVFCIGWVEESRSLARSIWGISSSSHRSKNTVRVVTLNCDSNRRCVDDLALVAPDIVLLQESPGRDELKRITETLFAGGGEFITAGDSSILARGRIAAKHAHAGDHFVVAIVTLPDQPPIECVSLRLAPPVIRVDFWSGGFWTNHRQMRDKHRQQLREMMHAVGQSSVASARIVGGDLNMTPLDRAFSEISDELNDTFSVSGAGWGATGTNELPLFRVDQIWSNRDCRPNSVYTMKSTCSDHRLVICELSGDD